jgi:hypothetical protein
MKIVKPKYQYVPRTDALARAAEREWKKRLDKYMAEWEAALRSTMKPR